MLSAKKGRRKAIKIMLTALEDDPDNKEIVQHFGTITNGFPDPNIETFFSKAILQNDPWTYLIYGIYLVEIGDIDRAYYVSILLSFSLVSVSKVFLYAWQHN